MRLYPAIDVKDGQCVRLKKGLFNEVTVYSERPYEIAKTCFALPFLFFLLHISYGIGTVCGLAAKKPAKETRNR